MLPDRVAVNVKVQPFAATGICDVTLDLVAVDWLIAQITLNFPPIPRIHDCREHDRQSAVFDVLQDPGAELTLGKYGSGGHVPYSASSFLNCC
jgi:hypothetical protein